MNYADRLARGLAALKKRRGTLAHDCRVSHEKGCPMISPVAKLAGPCKCNPRITIVAHRVDIEYTVGPRGGLLEKSGKFTLIELLIVLAIVAMLAVMVASVMDARAAPQGKPPPPPEVVAVRGGRVGGPTGFRSDVRGSSWTVIRHVPTGQEFLVIGNRIVPLGVPRVEKEIGK